MNDAKPWYESKTVWFNVATAVILVIGVLTTSAGADGKPLLPVTWIPILALISNVVNVILRSVTGQPITFSKPS